MKKGPQFDYLCGFEFSPDGKKFLYIATFFDEKYLVINNVKSSIYNGALY